MDWSLEVFQTWRVPSSVFLTSNGNNINKNTLADTFRSIWFTLLLACQGSPKGKHKNQYNIELHLLLDGQDSVDSRRCPPLPRWSSGRITPSNPSVTQRPPPGWILNRRTIRGKGVKEERLAFPSMPSSNRNRRMCDVCPYTHTKAREGYGQPTLSLRHTPLTQGLAQAGARHVTRKLQQSSRLDPTPTTVLGL